MSRIRRQEGFSLPELMIAATLMLVVLGATLTSLAGYTTRSKTNERVNDSQENLRRGMDQMQRQLRNLATPTAGVLSISRAQPFDVIFQTADPNKRWVRYCLDPADAGTLSGTASLWYQVSTSPSPTPPASTACPQPTAASGWTTNSSVGQAVVNARNSLARPIFQYNWPKDASGNDITSDTSKVTRIRSDLWVDVNPGRRPAETRLSSGVYLRNQNQAPVAAIGPPSSGGSRTVVLNGTASTDPEGRRLDYHWYYGTSPGIPAGCDPGATPPASYMGRGIVLIFTFPTGVTSPQAVTLCVADPGGLTATTTRTGVTF